MYEAIVWSSRIMSHVTCVIITTSAGRQVAIITTSADRQVANVTSSAGINIPCRPAQAGGGPIMDIDGPLPLATILMMSLNAKIDKTSVISLGKYLFPRMKPAHD